MEIYFVITLVFVDRSSQGDVKLFFFVSILNILDCVSIIKYVILYLQHFTIFYMKYWFLIFGLKRAKSLRKLQRNNLWRGFANYIPYIILKCFLWTIIIILDASSTFEAKFCKTISTLLASRWKEKTFSYGKRKHYHGKLSI